MGAKALTLLFCVAVAINCGGRAAAVKAGGGSGADPAPQKTSPITKSEAIRIATEDAKREGIAPEEFEIVAFELPDAWDVVFRLKNKSANGGGPKYLIDKATGKITSRKFTQ